MAEEYHPHSILITGAAGFIGSHVCNHLVKEYPDVKIVCYDAMTYCANMNNLKESIGKPNFEFIQGNILNDQLMMYVIKINQIDTILHFAAESHVDRSFGNSFEFSETNYCGTHKILECALKAKVKRFIHVSTDEVYGSVLDGKADEGSLLLPTNPYAASKAAAEMICHSFIESFKMPIIITRGNNVFGPYQFPEKVIPKFTYRLDQNKKCCIHGEGTALRNFLYIDDVVRAFDTILKYGQLHEIYNIGTEFEVSVSQVCYKIANYMKPPAEHSDDPVRQKEIEDANAAKWTEHVSDRAFNDSRYMIDSTKLRNLGWKPNPDFDGNLKKTVDWYLNNKNWWDQDYLQVYLQPHPLAYQPKTALSDRDNDMPDKDK